MTMKTTFAALALILAPSLSLAEGGCSGHDAVKDASISCAQGTTYDAATGTCVAGTNS
ncbi:MAG: adenylosuccinate lyase [Paracoccaceae bacterium]